MKEDAKEDSAAVIHSPRRAGEISTVGMHFPRRTVETSAEISIAGTAMAVTRITVIVTSISTVIAASISGDTIAPVLDSVSAFTRLTDMPLRSAIPPDSMTSTATGNTIPVALCRTDTKLDGRPAVA